MDLPLTLAVLSAAAVAIYVLADGYDLGIGILVLIAPRAVDRDTMMQGLAPFWNGNEIWLLLGGCLLCAAFPAAYTILLPAFYLPLAVMLFALIFRGIAFELRLRVRQFRRVWDFAFAGGSLLAILAQGFLLGGFIAGVSVRDGVFAGSALDVFSILGLLCCAGLVGGYALLGAGWVVWKTQGSTQIFGREVGHSALLLTTGAMALVSLWTALTQPEVADRWLAWSSILFLLPVPLVAAGVALALWRSLWRGPQPMVFVLGLVLFLLGFAGLLVSLFPYVVPRHVTIWSGAGDHHSLVLLGIGAAVILPIVLAYTAHGYWVSRGKVASDPDPSPGHPPVHVRRAVSPTSELHLS